MAARNPSAHRAAPARRRWAALLAVTAVLAGVAVFLPRLAGDATAEGWWPSSPPASARPVAAGYGPAAPGPAAPDAPDPGERLYRLRSSRSATPVGVASAALQLPGDVPARGHRTFSFAAGTGPVLGRAGVLRRFRVAVERGSAERPEDFAAQVSAALGDERSWVGGGKVRLQRVPDGARHDFTVYLATRDTAGRMCRAGGVDIRVGGRPYTSCRAPGQAIINLDRWRLSAPTFVTAGVPLATYRAYVVNHEVGHELGERHQGCPRRGGPAPVMVQQTLTLRGCTPYAWPRRDGRRFAGPLH